MAKKIEINEDWEPVEVEDLDNLFVVIFKHGSFDQGYVEAFDTDDVLMQSAYDSLANQYDDCGCDELTKIYLIKVPNTEQTVNMCNTGLFNGNCCDPHVIEATRDLFNRADCEQLSCWEGCGLTEAKKKKKPYSSAYCGLTDPVLNIKHFNQCMGTGGLQNNNGNKALIIGDVLPNAPVADAGSSDGASDANSSASEGGAMGESLNEDIENFTDITELVNDNKEELNDKIVSRIEHIYWDNTGKAHYEATPETATKIANICDNINESIDLKEWGFGGGIFLNGSKKNEERLLTKASLDSLEKALKEADYKLTRTSMSISAKHGGMWSTNGHISTLTINDLGDCRECLNTETSEGWLCSPKTGRLAEIIARAEEIDKSSASHKDKDTEDSTILQALERVESGESTFNFKAFDDNKLLKYYIICRKAGKYNNTKTTLKNELVQRGLLDESLNESSEEYLNNTIANFNKAIEAAKADNKPQKYIDTLIEYRDSLVKVLDKKNLQEDVTKELKIQNNENIEKDIEELEPPIEPEYFPNNMGINLSSVKKEIWVQQDDGQLKSIEVEFDPATEEEKEEQWVKENLTEAHLDYSEQLKKMQQLEAGTRGFNAGAASLDKILFNYDICIKHNLPYAKKTMEDALRMHGWDSYIKPTKKQVKILDYDRILKPGYVNIAAAKTVLANKDNAQQLIKDYGNGLDDLLVILVIALGIKEAVLAGTIKDHIINNFTVTLVELKDFLNRYFSNPATISDLSRVIKACKNDLKENIKLDEAKRYVKRYYVRPLNIFCGNKEDIIQALIRAGDQNCSVYSLKRLTDHEDVHLLQPSDIIYYWDDRVLYDKNHVQVMDYDLFVKHEEERKKVGNVDAISDTAFGDIYDDRATKDDLKDKEVIANYKALNKITR